jgi:1,4-dihydroxy-2-naphthoate octaprenyltransferase
MWLEAARPRTLPLALASIFMGSFLAASVEKFDGLIFTLCCLTTICLQVLSNFANDYGDTQNGADSNERVGPLRAVQSGEITAEQMFKGIVLFGVLSLAFGVTLLYFAFRDNGLEPFLYFLGLGLLCIAAAYTYTAGKNPYGYAGLGDISVLVFFGLVGVLGSLYMFTNTFSVVNLLPAMSCGFFATGVLNINNIRDIASDKNTGKRTIPTRLGKQNAIFYHWILLVFGMLLPIVYTSQTAGHSFWYAATFPLFFMNGIKVSRLPNPDPLLKQLALTTLLFVLLFGVSFFI